MYRVVAVFAMIATLYSYASEPSSALNLWSLASAARRYNYAGGDILSLKGIGSQWSIQYGQIYRYFAWNLSLDLLEGPFERSFEDLLFDVSGSGLQVSGGYIPIRLQTGSAASVFGVLALGSYHQLKARSFERSDYESDASSSILLSQRSTLFVSELGLGIFAMYLPGFNTSSLDSSRSWLTRNAGASLELSWSGVVHGSQRTSLIRKGADSGQSLAEQRDSSLRGSTVTLKFTFFLGV